jgi:competence protein ComEC
MSALALSVIVLLIADPWLSIDFGFALSVAATAGLLVLTQPIATRLQSYFPGWLSISISVSLAAQILCLPILLQLQSGIATYALPANVLAESLVAPVTVLGICACLIAWLFPPAAWCLTYLASEGTWLIAKIAGYFAGQQNVTLGWPTGITGAALAITLVIGFLLWFRAEPTRLRNLGLATLALIAAFSVGSIGFNLVRSASWPLSDWQVVACDVGQGDALVVRSRGLVALIDVGRENRPVDECLRKLAVQRIDLLVLTHFDMDHIGGLSGALTDRTVGLALVSPFKDERWGATGTNLLLAKAGVSTIAVESGMTGNLGQFQWRVLNPNRNAAGAEDSNDASVAMLWQTPEFNLLTLADLGEKGQMRISAQSNWWQDPILQTKPLILKVSHHGSADQFGELIEQLKPDLSLISVGERNSYGHPTLRTLRLLQGTGSKIERTDVRGSIAVAFREGGLVTANAPRG